MLPLLYATLDSVLHGLVLVDESWTIRHLNPPVTRLLGHTLESAKGRNIQTLLAPGARAPELVAGQPRQDSETLLYPHTALRHEDGRTIFVNLAVSTQATTQGTFFILDLQKILDPEQAQKEQDDREEQWRLFSLATTNLLWNWDLSNDRVERSVGFETAFGYRPEDIAEDISWWIDRIHDDDRAQVLATFGQTLEEGGEHCTYEYRFRRRDGSYTDIRDSVFIMRDDEGKGVRALGAMTDISNQKALEIMRARADRLASVGLLAAGVAHDFNNLLMGVTLATDLLADAAPPESPQQRLTDNIMKACAAMATLARRMLTFSRGGQPELRPVDLAQLIREHAELATSGSKVSLEFAFPGEPVIVLVDPSQIGQVINNIVLNAVQAMSGGGHIEIKLDIGATPADINTSAAEWITITITDDGPGIDEDALANIFEIYYTTRDEGHGLGLAVAASILNRHEGTLEARSQFGEGTIFTLGLPYRPTDEVDARNPRTARKQRSGTVLVLDDDETARLAICSALEHLGFDVTEAASGDEAVARYTEASEGQAAFSVALIDLTLRGGDDGATVAQRLRGIDGCTPMILMSGYGEKMALPDFADYGFAAKLAKPFDLDALSKALDEALSSGEPD